MMSTGKLQGWRPVVVAMLAVALWAQSPAFAATITGSVNFLPDCTGINVSGGGSVNWTRDTTGSNTEVLILEAFDGANNVLFSVSDTRTVGSSASFAAVYPYSSLPHFNPLTARLRSPAGNGFPEQIVVAGGGSCAALPGNTIPTLGDWGTTLLALGIGLVTLMIGRRRMRVER
jgi:hypothetical protein